MDIYLLKSLFKSTENKWQPIVRALEAILGKDGVIQRKDELLTYECDGLTGYRQRSAIAV